MGYWLKERFRYQQWAWGGNGGWQEQREQKVKRRERVKLCHWNHKMPMLLLQYLQLKKPVWSYSSWQWASVSVSAHAQKLLLCFLKVGTKNWGYWRGKAPCYYSAGQLMGIWDFNTYNMNGRIWEDFGDKVFVQSLRSAKVVIRVLTIV